jgi:hypothetical protein
MTIRIWYLTHLSALLLCCACDDSAAVPTGFAGAMGATGVAGTGAPLPATAGMLATAPAGASGGVAGATGGGVAGAAGSVTAGASAAAGGGAAGMAAVAGSTAIGGAAGAATAGMGVPAAGSGATAGASGAAGMPAMRMDLGKGDGSDVVTIGDSWMSYALNGGGIEAGLRTASMQRYRNYAVAGTMLLDEVIPRQYASAKRANPNIKTVVMTGGGNDVLTNTCTGQCKDVVDRVAARLGQLRTVMATDGVEDVIMISYGYPADQNRHAALDYSRSLLVQQCKKTDKPRCHFIDPVQQLMGKISTDGIHPTTEGYDILGQMAWDLMKAEGVRR